jgi:hypothetical protein
MKRRKYGLGVGEWDAIFERQGRRCLICGTDRPAGKHMRVPWHTDHDHATGALRGILCINCNLMLGYARDDQSILEKAIDYLNGRNASLAVAERGHG